MDERLKRIRESERKSHEEIYTDEKLYATDSWLKKPIKTVRDICRKCLKAGVFLSLPLVRRNMIFPERVLSAG